ncbi:LacI family DNA-binding transcriptional regulator [Niabella sp. CC-SYL272]|uniref:LacI family DNA-binding transcriptional regulator n=1 Tax=Niabella agricola TaxID=2891571 RepID=UPI001F22E994|nr:LacI family DNA-binding transcriptional regulator [Niabella agricola]MCF3108886.1 LacI family DNA-binding transcriptional regulator [Niabella agricola]
MKSGARIGVKDIARMTNVSIATVDRVLHNRPGVALATEKKIKAIIKKYDYRPNILARTLASRKVVKLAILIPAVSKETTYWQAPLDGISQAEAEVRQFGITIEKYFFDLNDKQSFVHQAKRILKSKADGVLMAPHFEGDAEVFSGQLTERKIPFVYINSDVPGQNSLSYIGPNLYRSGFLGGQLADFISKEGSTFLIVHISKTPDSYYHLLEKEKGFRAYFKDRKKGRILKSDIQRTDYGSIKKELTAVLKAQRVDLIFVTNSRVFYVARFLEEAGIKNIRLIGFDLIDKNINCLESGRIDFIISQKPREQAYRGVMALYNKLIKGEAVAQQVFMPIDILTKENYRFYEG